MKLSTSVPAMVGLVVVCVAASGCILLDARKDQQELARYGRIRGHVQTEHASTNPLIVVLFPASDLNKGPDAPLVILDHFVRMGPGSYGFRVEPGEYVVLAFEDVDGDGNYDPDEPLLNASKVKPFTLASGGEVQRDLVIPTDGRPAVEVKGPVDISAIQARSSEEQQARSLGSFLVRGQVATLSDEKFGSANGQRGLRSPLDFVLQVGAGIYLTEPYDPKRTVVLFVHGISGYPQEFTELIDSLDRDRFQAWFYFYPSGYRLQPLAEIASDLMVELKLRHGIDEFIVVAHSMGGLVSRAFLFDYLDEDKREDVPLFLSISSPYGGDDRAIKGVEDSPIVIPVWRDMASNSEFLKNLFWQSDAPDEPRTLPEEVTFHMMFSFKGESRGDISTDGSVAVRSELRLEAQHQAKTQLGLDYSHTGILRSDEAKQRLNALLNVYDD
jgi:pimeloyl-ACP methyl ester carboxylesterase